MPSLIEGDALTFVFALKSDLPVPEDGWTIVVHDGGCHDLDEDSDPTECSGDVACHLYAVDGESQEHAAGLQLASWALSAIMGRATDSADDLELSGVPVLRTVAVVSVRLAGERATPHDATEAALQTLRQASQALLQATGSLSPPVTRQQLQIMYFVLRGSDDPSPNIVFMDDAHLGGARATQEQADNAHRHFVAARNRDPAAAHHDLRLNAWRDVRADGDYAAGVLHAAIACEVLIKQASWYLTWEAQEALQTEPCPAARSSPDIFGSKPSQLIGNVLSPRLRGSWDSARPGAPIAVWREDVARLRNRIIHLGHRPTEDEAEAALTAMQALETHILDRLAQHSAVYPRTALKFVSRPGLERRGKYSKVVDEVWNTESIGDHLSQYVAWLAARSLPDDAD